MSDYDDREIGGTERLGLDPCDLGERLGHQNDGDDSSPFQLN